MKLPSVLTPPSIYHGCSTRKTFWDKIFTLVNMNNCGRWNVRKHRDINNGKKYTTLEIYLDFGIMDKIKIKYLETKEYLGRSGKGLITSLGLKTIIRWRKTKKEKYAITNISLKDVSKIIKESEKLLYECYMLKRSKHDPTGSYFI